MSDKPTHIDIFSGIGGFALAARWAGFETVAFCERDKYCQRVLRKHWTDVPIYDDVRNFPGDRYTGTTLLTGGFPCQPFSFAGKRGGSEDDRFLWPAMLAIIADVRPTWVIGENVPGIVTMELERVLFDLEVEGYSVWPVIVPACAVDAKHRRDRVWIVAHSDYTGCEERCVSEPIPSEDYPAEYCCTWRNETEWFDKSRMGRVADGISGRMDRLKGLGNAIVPQVAYELINMIKEIEQ